MVEQHKGPKSTYFRLAVYYQTIKYISRYTNLGLKSCFLVAKMCSNLSDKVVCYKSTCLLEIAPINSCRMNMRWSLNGPHWPLSESRKNFFLITRTNHCLLFPPISLQVASRWILRDLWSQMIGAYAPNLWKLICNSKMFGKICNHLC